MRLNDAQMVLLQLFQHRTMTEGELAALRSTLVRHLSRELDEEVTRVMAEKRIMLQDIDASAEAITQDRTAYMQRLRQLNK